MLRHWFIIASISPDRWGRWSRCCSINRRTRHAVNYENISHGRRSFSWRHYAGSSQNWTVIWSQATEKSCYFSGNWRPRWRDSRKWRKAQSNYLKRWRNRKNYSRYTIRPRNSRGYRRGRGSLKGYSLDRRKRWPSAVIRSWRPWRCAKNVSWWDSICLSLSGCQHK